MNLKWLEEVKKYGGRQAPRILNFSDTPSSHSIFDYTSLKQFEIGIKTLTGKLAQTLVQRISMKLGEQICSSQKAGVHYLDEPLQLCHGQNFCTRQVKRFLFEIHANLTEIQR